MKLLLVKLGHLGDVLLMTPTLRLLRTQFPSARIDVMVRRGTHAALEDNPDLSNLYLETPPKQERTAGMASGFFRNVRGLFAQRYDYGFDLSNSDRARLWLLLSATRTRCANNPYGELGKKRYLYNQLANFQWARDHQVLRDFRTVTESLHLQAEPGPLYICTGNLDTTALAQRLPFIPGLERYAVIHPTSRWAFKQWLPERWARVADWLTATQGLKVVFTSGPDPREQSYVDGILSHCQNKHAATRGATSLRELAWLISKATLFCGVDTVAMHLAAAVQTPTVCLFGPSSEWSWHPWQNRHELVLGACQCKQTRVFVCDKSRPYPCMEGITETEVHDKILKLMANSKSLSR
ncbi:MAG: putative lipopolysaccharide heptosyltransferase III [Verrucomicrobiota bacterium]